MRRQRGTAFPIILWTYNEYLWDQEGKNKKNKGVFLEALSDSKLLILIVYVEGITSLAEYKA